jgi:nucleosome assembly protein 1-like 1
MMPKEVQGRFKALKMLSDNRSKLNDQFEEEIALLEAKIAAKKKPLFESRKTIITGETTQFGDYVTKFDETMEKLQKQCDGIVTKVVEKKDDDKKEEEESKPVDVTYLVGKNGIPDFWFKAIKNNQMIFELVKEKDEDILQHIKHIDSEKTDKPNKSLQINFHFNPNDYFTNEVISLKIVYKPDSDEVLKTEGTVITWKDGKDVTKKKVKKKQKHKKTNETRTIIKTVDAESIFNVFASRTAPVDGEDTGLESEEENELLDKIDEQMNFAEDIEDVLIPDALEYYLGLNEDFFDEMGGDSDDSGDHDSDDDGSGDDDKKDKKKKGGDKEKKGAAKKGPDGKEQPECK